MCRLCRNGEDLDFFNPWLLARSSFVWFFPPCCVDNVLFKRVLLFAIFSRWGFSLLIDHFCFFFLFFFSCFRQSELMDLLCRMRHAVLVCCDTEDRHPICSLSPVTLTLFLSPFSSFSLLLTPCLFPLLSPLLLLFDFLVSCILSFLPASPHSLPLSPLLFAPSPLTILSPHLFLFLFPSLLLLLSHSLSLPLLLRHDGPDHGFLMLGFLDGYLVA